MTKPPRGDGGKEPRHIPAMESGKVFLRCTQCVDEVNRARVPGSVGRISHREYARLSVSFTDFGLQVWCERHHCNVVHIDFEGQKHPANQEARETSG